MALEPVDAVRLTTLVDNVSDMLLLDQGPAKRFGVLSMAGLGRIAEPLFEEGETVEGPIRSTALIGADGTVKKHWIPIANAEAHPAEVLEFLNS